jgi:fumarate reductase flavoprotein subunit/urocanate reductase
MKAKLSNGRVKILTIAAAVMSIFSVTHAAEYNYDVVVIGSGGAGLSAAVAASGNGSKVVVLEKLPMIGGHTVISGGSVNAPDPERQEKLGIKDSPKLYAEQTMKAGDYRNNPELVNTLANNASEMIKWFESMGLKWDDRIFEAWGGLYPRSHNTGAAQAGQDYIRVLHNTAKKYHTDIKTNTEVVEIMKDAKGVVCGVKTKNKKGNEDIYNAKSVVIATGGFTANKRLRQLYDPRLTPDMLTTANPTGKGLDGSTGDGILMGEKIGAATVGMDYMQLIPFAGGRVIDYVGGDIFVSFEGKRIVNEGGRRDVISDAILNQPNHKIWVITDSQSIKGASFEGKLKKGIVFAADNVKQMAEKMGVQPDVLKNTLDRYNKYAALKQDPDFGKTTFTQTIDKPPYYFGIERADIHFSCGGLQINSKAEVIDLDGHNIPGLYAAGEVTGGVHGTNRAGGNALTDIFVFGRIAGTNAALYSNH